MSLTDSSDEESKKSSNLSSNDQGKNYLAKMMNEDEDEEESEKQPEKHPVIEIKKKSAVDKMLKKVSETYGEKEMMMKRLRGEMESEKSSRKDDDMSSNCSDPNEVQEMISPLKQKKSVKLLKENEEPDTPIKKEPQSLLKIGADDEEIEPIK